MRITVILLKAPVLAVLSTIQAGPIRTTHTSDIPVNIKSLFTVNIFTHKKLTMLDD